MKIFTIISLLSAAVTITLAYENCATAHEKELKEIEEKGTTFVLHDCDGENYKPLQKTYAEPHWCWCFDSDGGVVYGPTKCTNIESCQCILEKSEAIKKGLSYVTSCDGLNHGSYRPFCERKGYFVTIQSNSTHHWCAKKENGCKIGNIVTISEPIHCD